MTRNMKHVFEPMPSRRLGISLGIDLVPHKTCPLDCVYCECGDTTNLTLARREYVPLDAIKAELAEILSTAPALDYVTFSRAGEPTLHAGIGDLISWLKQNFPKYKICLLTNGMLLDDKALIAEVRLLDLIVPSLDAADEEAFVKINRPHSRLSAARVVEALAEFRRVCPIPF